VFQTFEVGEIAVVCNSRFHPQREGEEVTICTPYKVLSVRQHDGTLNRELGYGVVTREGYRFIVQPWQLRKKRLPETLGSWDQCIWRPKRGAIRGG
jgi:hypothetical protein